MSGRDPERSGAGTDTVAGVLAGHCAVQPDASLLLSASAAQAIDYAGLARLGAQLASWFEARGIGAGRHVAMMLPNGVAASALFLTTMAAGRVIVPLSLVAQPSQLRFILAHCQADCILTDDEHAPMLRRAMGDAASHERLVIIDPDRVEAGPWSANEAISGAPAVPGVSAAPTERAAPPEPAPSAVAAFGHPEAGFRPSPHQNALLMYTSGTTGTPKGVPLTHGNLLHAARAVAAWHGLGPSDRVLSALPLYHINGQVIATLTPFVSGGSIVAPARFSVSSWWQTALERRCTWLNMVPTIIAYLLNAQSQAPARLPLIRFGRSASAPLPAEHHQAFEHRFGFPVIEAMGMTESASVVFCNPMPPRPRRSGSPGVPLAVQVKIIDEQGKTVPDGSRGEICLRGPSVMAGYFRAPEQTATAFTADGWLRSGDLGMRDADGFHVITGRLKELIIKGGENIAPREIDEALLGHPDILEAAAVGIPDEAYGQDILAAVVLREGAVPDEPALRAYCEAELGRYKTPRVFRFVNQLPKGASGKVQRLKLLDEDTG